MEAGKKLSRFTSLNLQLSHLLPAIRTALFGRGDSLRMSPDPGVGACGERTGRSGDTGCGMGSSSVAPLVDPRERVRMRTAGDGGAEDGGGRLAQGRLWLNIHPSNDGASKWT